MRTPSTPGEYAEYKVLKDAVQQAQQAFDSTPAGLAALDDQIRVTDGVKRGELQARRSLGQNTRNAALNAYKQKQLVLTCPDGWSITSTVEQAPGVNSYRISNPNLDITVEKYVEAPDDLQIYGELNGRSALFSYQQGCLYGNLAYSKGAYDRFGLLTPVSNLGMTDTDTSVVTGLIRKIEALKTT